MVPVFKFLSYQTNIYQQNHLSVKISFKIVKVEIYMGICNKVATRFLTPVRPLDSPEQD